MRIPLDQVRRDYLALRGESPELLPELAPGEESPVLTLSEALRVRLLDAAQRATLATSPLLLDEIASAADLTLLVGAGAFAIARLPSDYLKLHTLRMKDWAEPLLAAEPADSLRARLGSDAPGWMVCRHRPMVVEARDTEGLYLKIYGSRKLDTAAELLYVPRPRIEGDEIVISEAAYQEMLKNLADDDHHG
ncbi:MAG: hypothetical protein J1E97_04215 [Muribaculaceae bacterium]|nr:hypothetical protein [Muribaculaceae bacterium]